MSAPRFAVGDRVRLAWPLQCERELVGLVVARNACGSVRVEWDGREPDGRGAPWYLARDLVRDNLEAAT